MGMAAVIAAGAANGNNYAAAEAGLSGAVFPNVQSWYDFGYAIYYSWCGL